ncbi:MAG TPA: hypothetical protein VF653_00950 [Methylomirabilota bacterium]
MPGHPHGKGEKVSPTQGISGGGKYGGGKKGMGGKGKRGYGMRGGH